MVLWKMWPTTPSRASSTKTRIETPHLINIQTCYKLHQEQVPRKQGLKPNHTEDGRGIDTPHQEQVPRKQGLKRYINILPNYIAIHQEQVPRKQGLKQDM